MKKENNVVLSVIMPVYNVQDFIHHAVESLLIEEHIDDIEIILVDDGSTDSSGLIANEYGKNVKIIKDFHKVNGGLSDARNFGFLKATGKYVFFMDSDDKVDTKQFPKILDFIKNSDSDVILWDAKLINEEGIIINTSEHEYYSHKGMISNKRYNGIDAINAQLVDHNDFVTTVWLGAYKREFLLKHALMFEYGLLHEDELWTPRVLCHAESVEYLDIKLYEYRIRSNSIMTNKGKDRSRNLNDLIYIFSNMYNFYDRVISDVKMRNKLKSNVSKRYLHRISYFNAYKYRSIANKIDKIEIFKNSKGLKDKSRSFVLLVSGKLYCNLTKFVSEGGEN